MAKKSLNKSLSEAKAAKKDEHYTQFIETQKLIVAEIEAEQALVNANHELITRFEKKIQATIARIWGQKEDTKGTEE